MKNLFSSLRQDALYLIGCLAFILLVSESDSILLYFLTKLVGLALFGVCYLLYRYWDRRGLLSGLHRFMDEE